MDGMIPVTFLFSGGKCYAIMNPVQIHNIEQREDFTMDTSRIDWAGLEEKMVAFRRARHRRPESGWTEFLTTSEIVHELRRLGFTCVMGKDIHTAGDRYAVPDEEELEACMTRALSEGADPELVEIMRGGYTGAVGILDTGRPGPTTALRVDIDCNDVEECREDDHLPHCEGFDSLHPKLMHACGHDGHASIGLGVANVVAACADQLRGKIMIIFQPAEEGCRGSASMAKSGILEGVDYLFGGHLTARTPYGTVYGGSRNLACGYKIDLFFRGQNAHAGIAPEEGHNAAAAAANTILNALAIPRNGKGLTRINIGTGEFGPGRNVIPGYAVLRAEVRGGANALADYMYEKLVHVGKASAEMYDCEFEQKIVGHSIDATSDIQLVKVAEACAEKMEEFDTVKDYITHNGASDDVTALMEVVQKQGGKATYLSIGSGGTAPHHNPRFDIDERALLAAAKLYCGMIGELNGIEAG